MAAFIGNHTQRHANLNPPMRQFLLTGVYSQSFRVCCPGAAHDPQGDYQSWLGKFEQRDKWSFCLRAARMAAEQEKR
jgi:hypothetical protein